MIYPRETLVLDYLDLAPRLTKWIETTPQNMGNWVSKYSLRRKTEMIDIEPVLVVQVGESLQPIDSVVSERKVFIAIGYDLLQIPISKIEIKLVNSSKI